MIESTLELIVTTLAASNPLFAFCFCNLIIFILLLGSKPASHFDQSSTAPAPILPVVDSENKNNEFALTKCLADDDRAFVSEDGGDEYEGNDEDGEELRRRVEEFIEKVNRGWRAEMLRTSLSVER